MFVIIAQCGRKSTSKSKIVWNIEVHFNWSRRGFWNLLGWGNSLFLENPIKCIENSITEAATIPFTVFHSLNKEGANSVSNGTALSGINGTLASFYVIGRIIMATLRGKTYHPHQAFPFWTVTFNLNSAEMGIVMVSRNVAHFMGDSSMDHIIRITSKEIGIKNNKPFPGISLPRSPANLLILKSGDWHIHPQLAVENFNRLNHLPFADLVQFAVHGVQ